MSEYVITEEELCKLIHGIDDALECHYFMKTIRSRPLSSVLKSKREKTMDDLCNLFRWTNKESNFRPWNIEHIEQVIRKYRECLRSEQP